MPRWKKYSLILFAVVLGILLLSMLIVPWVIKKQGTEWVAENTTRTLHIEKVFFNPFALTIEVEGLALSEQQKAATFVSFKRLMLSASLRSIIDLAIILDRVELDDPYVNIELLGKQEFNFSDFTRLGGDTPPKADPEPGRPLQFSFNNIVLSGGKINFTDLTSEKKSQHQITELALSVPFVGNVSYLTDDYVEPQLRLLLNGSEISAVGQLKPFHHSLETSLSLVLNEIDLAYYSYHSPVPLPIDVKSGILDTQIDLTYRISASEQPKLLLGGELALTDIDIRALDGAELFRMPTLILELDWADLLEQDFNVRSLDIYEPQLFVARDRQGAWNFQALSADQPGKGEEVQAEKQQNRLPRVKVEELALIDGKVHLQDQFPPGGITEELHGINLRLNELSTLYDQKTALEFWFATDRQLTTRVTGEVGIEPPTATLDLVINGVPLEPYYPYLAEFLSAPLTGSLNLAGTVNYNDAGNLQLQQAQMALHKLHIPFSGKDAFNLDDLLITGGSFDLQQNQASLATITLRGGNLVASRLADGSLSPAKLLRSQPSQSDSQPAPAKTTSPAFSAKIGTLELEDFTLQLRDASLARKPKLDVAQLNISLADLAYPQSQQSPFKVKANIGKKGHIALSGSLAYNPLRVQAQTQITALPLTLVNDFLPENIKVSLKDGTLHTNLALKLLEQPDGMTGSFGGRVTVNHFNLRDPLDSGDLLAWESLNLEEIKGEISPFKLAIKDVALSNYLAKIQIDAEGQVNLSNISETEPAEEGAEKVSPAPAPEVTTAEQPLESGAPAADIRIDAVTLQGGTVSFTDRHLPSTFSATMYKLGGRITGLASEEQMQADVDLRGELENHSPLTIVGKINPLSKDLYADLTISFKDIDLAPMTPYSGTYLGYVIDKGKLYLDLSYRIEHQQISATNKVMIDQFTFGDTVKSDQATSLPVGLAIALLKDSNDEIHLDVPISGDLNDPSFSIMGTVFTILKNLLVKAATSPFSLLSSMLGGKEDFSSLTFTSGAARLDGQQQELLGKLAGMLKKRPSLILEISAFVDQEKDPEGYRQEQLQQKILDAMWRDLQEQGQAPERREQLVINTENRAKYLLEVYKEAEFPRPRNFVGLLKTLPESEMEKLLLANIEAGSEELQALARSRAQRVRDLLLTGNEEIKAQVFLKAPDIYQPPEKGPASRVEFSIKSK